MDRENLDRLRHLSTPTLSNAIELFAVRPRNAGFMSPQVGCIFPDLGVMVGHAVTARYAACDPGEKPAARDAFWRHILEFPEPRVLVMEDLDQPPGVGAYFGEVQSTVHKRLGCAGMVTNGHVRDLDEVRALGFHFFAGGVCVSHAYVHLVDFGSSVKVGGIEVKSGDIIHADKHGVLVVPEEVIPGVLKAANTVTERETRILEHCKSPDFNLAELNRLFDS